MSCVARDNHAMSALEQRGIYWPRRFIGLMVALLLAYLVSPYLSFWLFTQAVHANDRAALESHVDFPSVRQSLKDELRSRVRSDPKKKDRFSGIVARVAPSLIDQLVDAFVTPENLAALLSDPGLMRQAKAENSQAISQIGDHHREVKWSRVSRAFFTGPKTFVADLDETKLVFRLSHGHWQLKKVGLRPNQ